MTAGGSFSLQRSALIQDSAHSPTVTRVLFTTSRHAGELMQGQSVGLADDAVVCYVELSGTFTGGSAPGVTPTVTHTAAIVFDGHSGNMLGIEA
jgi:hypothetical protein